LAGAAYSDHVSPSWTLVLAGLVGLVVGALAVLAFRGGERERLAPVDEPEPDPELPPGVSAVLGVLRSAAVVLDAGDGVVKATPAAYAFGLVRGHDLAHPQVRELVAEARRLGLVREQQLELARGPLGRAKIFVYARVAPLGSDLVLVLVDDRTEARRVEEIRRDFVANVSHELKTPIGALRLLAEAVADAAEEPDAVRRFAARMEREAVRLTTLVQEIIDLSRLQVADALHQPEPVAVDDVVAEAIDRVSLAAQRKRIEVGVGGDHGAVVYGDHSLLVTAVRNLVDNAIAYSPDATRVAVTVRRSGGLVEISVSDQGFGIAPADIERIFERFYRVDPARSRATGGTGLGLSIVKHVAANHGGEVTVWSVEGEGSTFTLRLPDSAQRLRPPGTSSAPAELPEAIPVPSPMPSTVTSETAPGSQPAPDPVPITTPGPRLGGDPVNSQKESPA
jgi:two-component system sensor histidine kinase SenX3